ncbi:MAG: hypothetical protein AAF709_17120, partial [Pseudomonadota bacterium]
LAGVICLSLIAPAAIALGQQTPQAGEPVIVITAPWENALAIASKADGGFIAPGRMQAIVLVRSNDPNFTRALYTAGAWMVLNADLSGVLCKVE